MILTLIQTLSKYRSNADLELRTNGSGAIIIDDFIIKANRIETASSDMVFAPVAVQ